MVYNYPLATAKARNPFAHRHNGPGHLMSENARRRVRARVNLLQISSADAARCDLYQQLSRTDPRHRDRLHAHVVDSAVDYGSHRAGNLCFDLALRFGGLRSHSVNRCDLTPPKA